MNFLFFFLDKNPIQSAEQAGPEEPTQCNEIIQMKECGQAVVDGIPCIWERHDQSCVQLECENRPQQDCNGIAACNWHFGEQKCLEKFQVVLSHSYYRHSQTSNSKRNVYEFSLSTLLLFFGVVSLLSFSLSYCLLQWSWRKAKAVEEILLWQVPPTHSTNFTKLWMTLLLIFLSVSLATRSFTPSTTNVFFQGLHIRRSKRENGIASFLCLKFLLYNKESSL